MKRRKEGREKERKQWRIQDFLDEVGGDSIYYSATFVRKLHKKEQKLGLEGGIQNLSM